ncbi:MAG TPA: coproporphyrinogen-III oxidase family protein [Candidatus Polarisedimenticolaceae bacterium]|nr:coproporphyrinogen-III oxidase family protein [Candidatus Polarisedimenticolaceae bacterium]
MRRDEVKTAPERSEPNTAVGADPKETGLGSNFVSNYPPYSFWKEEDVRLADTAFDREPRDRTPLGLYLHIPFCRKRCKFCYFKVFTDKRGDEVQRYLDAVVREVASYAGRAAVAGRPLEFVYFGGGTPSFISARHLRVLVAGLKHELDWSAVREVTFECEPGTLTEAKLHAIREVGVTRLSLGIENFDDRILAENGRAHTTREIYRVEPWIRQIGFEQLNIDLIAGMVGESWDSWRETVRRTLEMAPDSVTVYQMELPYNTVYSQRLLDGREVGIADWATKRAWHAYAFEQLSRLGYRGSSAYTMVRADRDVRFVYRDSVWHGCDLLGIGVSSFGHISGVHYQNESRWDPYLDAVESGRSAIARAFVTDASERLVRETILLLKRGYLDARALGQKHGADVVERFRPVVAELSDRGLMTLSGDRIELTREGLLRVDQLLPHFYHPRYQNARYT